MTHVVLIVMLKFFIKNTHGLAYVAFTNISSRLWLGDNAIWHILSIKEIYQVFIQAYNLLLLLKILKHTIRFDPYCPFKKNYDKTAFELHFTSQNVNTKTILSSTSRALFFSLFSSKVVFFSIFTSF